MLTFRFGCENRTYHSALALVIIYFAVFQNWRQFFNEFTSFFYDFDVWNCISSEMLQILTSWKLCSFTFLSDYRQQGNFYKWIYDKCISGLSVCCRNDIFQNDFMINVFPGCQYVKDIFQNEFMINVFPSCQYDRVCEGHVNYMGKGN